jgi:polysaccharide pyruvyl transferase WcaK-like protein
MISSLDLLISSRLHLGVAAMSYGVPFMSVGGEGKTRTLFREAGIEEMCFDIGDILRFIRLFRDSRQWKRFLENSVLPDVSALRAQSRGHLEELKRIVSSIRSKVS